MEPVQNLSQLWQQVAGLNQKHFPQNKLAPILGGGQAQNPRVMFVFINPTYRNLSSNPRWTGPRYPFIGTREVWRVFHRSGFLSGDLMQKIEDLREWPVEFAKEVEEFLRSEGLYLTNLVKWTGADGALPSSQMVDLFLPVLRREIELVQPRSILTFGLLPFRHLTQEDIKLKDYYGEALNSGHLKDFPLKEVNFAAKVTPCYFPVGRGNPKRAVEILKLFQHLSGRA